MKTNFVAIYHHPGMQPLHEIISRQDHRTLVLWALETGEDILKIYKTVFPDDPRPEQALEAADAWSRGNIKMPLAKKAARETHEAAKDAKGVQGMLDVKNPKIDAAIASAHAMGQIIGVVHVATHSTSYAAYAVQALVLFNTLRESEEVLTDSVNYLSARLMHWASANKDNRPWATFL
jgi:hypothetical protein